MRVKEFIMFIIVFTICYVGFFVFFDIVHNKNSQKKQEKRLHNLFQTNKILVFLKFYGIENPVVTGELLKSIYEEIKNMSSISISVYSEKYGIQPYEFVVCVLYLEYFQFISRKSVSVENDLMKTIDSTDQQLIMKYGTFFSEKKSYQQIIDIVGDTAVKELNDCNQCFLTPGVRIINSTVYYVGDIDEKV